MCASRSPQPSASARRWPAISVVRPLADGGQPWLVAAAPAHLAHELGERRLARRERGLQAVEHRAHGVVLERVAALEVAGEHGAHGLARGGRALLGEEEPVGGVLERGGALEPVDAVVRERALEVHDEAVGQALGRRRRASAGTRADAPAGCRGRPRRRGRRRAGA